MAMKGSHKLSDIHKRFVVQCLAQFLTPKETADAVNEAFGIEISPQAMEHYDPNKKRGRPLAKHLDDLYHETRKKFLKDASQYVPIANKSVRLRKLSKAAASFEGHGNYLGMAQMLEQAAKEVGGSYTNRREITGKDRGPLEIREVESMTEDEIDAELRQLGIDPNVHPAASTTQ